MNLRLNIYEIKSIYKFLDTKTLGYFTKIRWNSFFTLFVKPFMECDTDNDCKLTDEELKTCIDNPNYELFKKYMPEGYEMESFAKEIVFSLDHNNNGGINLENFILFKRIFIGFKQYQIVGLLDNNSFQSAIRTSFNDKFIDDVDSELAFRISINLMFEQVKDNKLNFIQFFESCRLINTYMAFGVTMGEGYLTRIEILNNLENNKFPSKIKSDMVKKYFDSFKDDIELNINAENTKFDPNSLRFEDWATLEFYANIFQNYTQTEPRSMGLMNDTGFTSLFMENRYTHKKHKVYIAFSNFQNYEKISETTFPQNDNITDFDFLTSATSFLELESNYKKFSKFKISHKMNLRNKELSTKEGSSVFSVLGEMSKVENTNKNTNLKNFEKNLNRNNLGSSSKMKSLFELKLTDDVNDEDEQKKEELINKLLAISLKNYFMMLDMNMDKSISFNEVMTFIKFLRLFTKLNKSNHDKRGIIKSNSINGNYLYLN